MSNNPSNREHEFTLVVDGVRELDERIESALFEAGCDDATISMRSGRMFITFCREAPSLKEAVFSSLESVSQADIGATVIRVDYCNLVTQSNIARRISRTRQQVHQYIVGTRGPGNFPPPACEITDGAPLYFWCEVARWLLANDMIQEHLVREAEELDVINSVLELQWKRRLTPELTEEMLRFVKFCDKPECPALK